MTYTIALQQTPDGCWIGQVVELPAVMDQGETKEELFDNIKEGIIFYLEAERQSFTSEPGMELITLSVA